MDRRVPEEFIRTTNRNAAEDPSLAGMSPWILTDFRSQAAVAAHPGFLQPQRIDLEPRKKAGLLVLQDFYRELMKMEIAQKE